MSSFVSPSVLYASCRFMKVELRHLSFISDKLDKGNTCPACPKVIIIIMMCECAIIIYKSVLYNACKVLWK